MHSGHIALYQAKNDHIGGVVVIFTDITERKRSE